MPQQDVETRWRLKVERCGGNTQKERKRRNRCKRTRVIRWRSGQRIQERLREVSLFPERDRNGKRERAGERDVQGKDKR